ncbi:MAG: ABC transporter permease [Pseudomonadota bacterium]
MSKPEATLEIAENEDRDATVFLAGDWLQGQPVPDFNDVSSQLGRMPSRLVLDGSSLESWDSTLMAFILQCHNYCHDHDTVFDTNALPTGAAKLLRLATAVPAHKPPKTQKPRWHPVRSARALVSRMGGVIRDSLSFTGEVSIALARLLTGRSNTRFEDFGHYCYQAGPNALGIISLTSILVGMILAYLGAVQLQQFGAEIYVANLVTIGILREMGVLMTAVVMAGRTGAAYAAQLGTMQTNEEIDAIKTMGISPVEFLVIPRILALMVTMPLLTLYANILGIVGGGIVAGGMGITPLQYFSQTEQALALNHLAVGLIKSVVFAVLIAVAGCRAGINAGRSSAAVGQAATEAVVTAVVYLIVADAALNIMFQVSLV